MNKLITQNYILLASSCLLLASTQALADRPAMNEDIETFEPEVIDVSNTVEEAPVLETVPEMEEMPDLETSPETEEISAVEVEMQHEPVADEAEPVIHVYDHRTETEITGDVIQMQSGETIPVRVIDFPRRGMTMDKVRNELGEPLEVSDTIGEPPITTWTYSDRVVYFEYTSVVHVVATN